MAKRIYLHFYKIFKHLRQHKKMKQSWQWKKGENYKQIEISSHEDIEEDMTFIVFESGRKINKNLVDEFLVKLESPDFPIITEDALPEKHLGNALLDYPTLEDIQAMQKQDGTFSAGAAVAIPHPNDVEKLKKFNELQQKQSVSAKLKAPQQVSEQPINNVSSNVIKKSPTFDILNKARKQEYDLTLSIKVKLPIQGFFDLLDEDFVKTNQNAILNDMITKIKQEELDTQLKENLIKIYNIQENVQS